MDSAELLDVLRARAVLDRGLADPKDVAAALSKHRFLDAISLLADLSAADRLAVEADARGMLERLRGPGPPAPAVPTHAALTPTTGAVRHDGLPTLNEERYGSFRPLGSGGMGVVYLAMDRHMGRQVALKLVRPGEHDAPTDTPQSVSPPEAGSPHEDAYRELEMRFLVEAWVTGGLEHPGIVPVYELGRTAAGIPYYTMRMVRGERTLREAIAEAHQRGDLESRLMLLDPLLKALDTVGYAHAQGVVHRDLKPEHVALGTHGETVVIDWGIARVLGSVEPAGALIHDRVEGLRQDQGGQTRIGGRLGTPGYASPEAARGDVQAISPRSDVFALGVVLYECLTGRAPHPRQSGWAAYYASLSAGAPVASETDPVVPEALSAIAARAMSFEPAARYADASELAGALRAWQAKSQVERQVEGWLREARTGLDEADASSGDDSLRRLDRVFANLSLAERAGHASPDARRLKAHAVALRTRGIAEASRASRQRFVRRSAAVLAVLVTLASVWVAQALDERRREAEAERDAKAAALAEVLRLSDAKMVRDLVTEADALWPVSGARAAAMLDWLDRSGAVIGKRGDHAAALAEVRARSLPYSEEDRAADRERAEARLGAIDARVAAIRREIEALSDGHSESKKAALGEEATALASQRESLASGASGRTTWRFANDADSWRHQVLLDLLADVEALVAPRGLRARVTARHETAATLRRRSLEEAAEAWRRAIDAVASSPRYGGLGLAPIEGLVPLGADPDSGLVEFAHLGSGTVPTRDPETGRLAYADDAGVVLVLIPGGSFWMGAQKDDPARPNYDARALKDEAPVHRVTLSPFFLAKHECTQAQWKAMTEGEDPSAFKAGRQMGDRVITVRNPVEQVSFDECERWLSRHRLRMPTEAQWEYACRAGADTPWFTGRDHTALAAYANLGDRHAKEHGGPLFWRYMEDVDDGFAFHAPAGSLSANPFGLHDITGNVWEWCRDAYKPYDAHPLVDPEARDALYRVHRGGSWLVNADDARCSSRFRDVPEPRFANLGVRPSLDLPAAH